MLNIVIPIAGKSTFFNEEEYQYPKPLIEIAGKPMIEWVIDNLNTIKTKKRFIFIVNKTECIKYHLDNVLSLATDNNCEIIRLHSPTKGAACSCLLAIEHINNDHNLIIANGDQIINTDYEDALSQFHQHNVDAGVITFKAIHPKWSYVQIDNNNKIVETAEKRPISKNAIAGFYYFKKGKYFIESAMESIRKDASVNGLFYIAPTLNELILRNMNLEAHKIHPSKYLNFYSPQRIKDFEKWLEGC